MDQSRGQEHGGDGEGGEDRGVYAWGWRVGEGWGGEQGG